MRTALLSLLTMAVFAPNALGAQDGGVSLELGAARAFPPSGTDALQASYSLLGLRAEHWQPNGSGAWAAIRGGLALDEAASNWGSAEAGAQLWTPLSSSLDLGLGIDTYGFTVSEPFVHQAITGTFDGRLRLRLGRVQLLVNGEGGTGRSVLELIRTDIDRFNRNGFDRDGDLSTAVRRAEQDLWHFGGGPEVRVAGARAVASLAGGVYEAQRGTYRQVTASLAGFFGNSQEAVWRVVVSGWETPVGNEMTGGLALSFPLGRGWSASASGLRTEPSPLIRSNGGTHGGLMLQWKPLAWSSRTPSVYSIGKRGDKATAAFTLEQPNAQTVDVVGDFSGWEPIAMERGENEWVLTLPVAPGVYHFGFVVDGEWYLPEEGIPGRVSDEWGRDNGTLVVPDGEYGANP